MPDFSFHSRLRALRAAHKVTQDRLAEVCGVSQPTIAGWESGGPSPAVPELARLARFFGVAGDYLLGISDSETGLSPDSWIVDLDAYDTGPMGEAWAVKVPRRHRIVPFQEYQEMRQRLHPKRRG